MSYTDTAKFEAFQWFDLRADSIPSMGYPDLVCMYATHVSRRNGKSVALPRLGLIPKSDSIALFVVPCPDSAM
jgi:hypothetical protein